MSFPRLAQSPGLYPFFYDLQDPSVSSSLGHRVPVAVILSLPHTTSILLTRTKVYELKNTKGTGTREETNSKASFTLQAEPSRAEPIRLGKQTYVIKWKYSHYTPNRIGPSLTERVHCLMFVFTRQPTTDSVAQ